MAGKVDPGKSIFFSILGYGYLYFLIADVVFLVLWLLVGSKWFLLSLVSILLRYGFLPLYFQTGGTELLTEGERVERGAVKIMTFNVHHFKGEDFVEGVQDTNMMQFLRMIDRETPDVLALQEYVGCGDTLHLTERIVERGYRYQISGYTSGAMTGEVIFSKLPTLGVVRFEEPRNFYADLLWRDDTLRVYCLHLESYGLDDSDQKQLDDIRHGNMDSKTGRSTYHKFRETIHAHGEEWQLIEQLLSRRTTRTIVAGDFNDPPSSYFYQQSRTLLKDSYCEAGQGFSTTYHGNFTRRRNAIFPSFRIDMVLHTPDMEAIAYKRIKSDISDHYPVVVTLGSRKKE